jgi:hypothetical protein
LVYSNKNPTQKMMESKMSKKRLLTVCAIAGVLVSTPAFAFFSNQEAAPPAPKPSFDLSGSTNVVTQVGEGIPAPVKGFGDELPMEDSIDMILPDKWQYNLAEGVDLSDKEASWQADGTWIDSLEKIGEDNDLRFLVDWKNNQVIVGQADPQKATNVKQMQKELIAEQEAERAAEEQANKEEQERALTAKELGPTWEIKPGSLKTQLTEWANKAQWQIVWTASTDYQLQARAEIQDSFTAAVTQVIQSMRNNGAPLRAYIYRGNRVVLVKGE